MKREEKGEQERKRVKKVEYNREELKEVQLRDNGQLSVFLREAVGCFSKPLFKYQLSSDKKKHLKIG